MKTRTDTGMSRIRLASLALLAGLLLTIAWPLNISAQTPTELNWKRFVEEQGAKVGKAAGNTTKIGDKNGGGLLNNKNNEYNVPSLFVLWNECYSVLVREANSLLNPGTTPAEAKEPASGKLRDNSGLVVAPTVFDRIRGMDSLTEGVSPDSNFIQQEAQVKSSGQEADTMRRFTTTDMTSTTFANPMFVDRDGSGYTPHDPLAL